MAETFLYSRPKLVKILPQANGEFKGHRKKQTNFNALIIAPQDAHTCGEIILGSSNDGYRVSEDFPTKLPGMHGFMLHDPTRANGGYPLMAGSEDAKQKWMKNLRYAIAEMTGGTPDQSVAPSTYEDDEDLYATIEEVQTQMK